MQAKIGNGTLELVQGDITAQEVDAIVNAANTKLAGGGGVDGAIHKKGGPAILAECRRIGGCPTGQTVMTDAGKLPCRKVLHTVGPIWRGGGSGEPELLTSCYRTALELALENGLDSVAFASISTGIYGYPLNRAAPVAMTAIIDFMEKNDAPSLVRMVLFDKRTHDAYCSALREKAGSQRVYRRPAAAS